MEKKRYLKYDVIRIAAILLVLMCHASAFLVLQYPDSTTLEFQMGNIPNGISRACIPLFVMLSGALLLKEEKPFNTKDFYRRSLLWVGLLLVGWLLAYALFYTWVLPSILNTPVDWANFGDFILKFKGTDYPHLWYLFMVVGLYLMTPVFRLFVKKENVKYIVGIVTAAMIYTFLTKTLNVFLVHAESNTTGVTDFVSKFHLEGLGGYTAYFLLGWLLDNFQIKKPFRIVIYAFGLISVTTQITVVWLVYNEIPNIRSFLSADLTLPVFLYGSAVFLLICNVCKEKCHQSKTISALSGTAFGVYAIHVFLLELFTKAWLTPDRLRLHPMLYFLLIYTVTVVSSFLLSYLISKVKYLRKAIHVA